MTTHVPTPFYFWTVDQNTNNVIFTAPKVSSLTDVPSYAAQANKYIAVNSDGTGLTYVAGNGGAAPTTYASLSDVNSGSLSSSVGYFAVVGEDGASITYLNPASVTAVTLFTELDDTFKYAGNGLCLVRVNNAETALEATNFSIEDIPGVQVDQTTQLMFYYLNSAQFAVYTNRPRSTCGWYFNTPQTGFQNTNAGYDTTKALTSITTNYLTIPFYNIGTNATNMTASDPTLFVTFQNTIGTFGNIWQFSSAQGWIKLLGYQAATREGLKQIIPNPKIRVTITAYVQFDNNPDKAISLDIGFTVLGTNGLVKTQAVFDTTTIKATKPGKSGKINKTFIIPQLLVGEYIQPVFRSILLNNDGNPEIQIVSISYLVEEV